MSHFLVMVVMPQAESRDAYVERVLAPYSEHLSVPPYPEECWCLGSILDDLVKAELEGLGLDLGHLRRSFVQPAGIEAASAAWKEHIAGYLAARLAIEERLRPTVAPAPACEECGGSGALTTTRNPKSKWDWWQIGGRFAGTLRGRDVSRDPRNREQCRSCHGAGCIGCMSTGSKAKWPSEWVVDDGVDEVPASELLAGPFAERCGYAIVTPDGEWHQRGEMGWWGMGSDEKAESAWVTEARAILADFPDHVVVSVDCHI